MNIAKLQLLMAQSKVNNSNLASMSGVSDVTISKILNGADAKISTIERIAEALKVPVGYFLMIQLLVKLIQEVQMLLLVEIIMGI